MLMFHCFFFVPSDVILKTARFRDTPRTEIHKSISNALKNSHDWDGQRGPRQKKFKTNSENDIGCDLGRDENEVAVGHQEVAAGPQEDLGILQQTNYILQRL